jgi:hypothetical protein
LRPGGRTFGYERALNMPDDHEQTSGTSGFLQLATIV